MNLFENIKYDLFVLIANKAKNNYDKEAYIDLNEIGINRNEDDALALSDWLEKQEYILSVKYNGHCHLKVCVESEFIEIYSTEE